MKPVSATFSKAYLTALQAHLGQKETESDITAILGQRAVTAGIGTLDLANLHERLLQAKVLPDIPASGRAAGTRRAAEFFAAVLVQPLAATSQSEAVRRERRASILRLKVEVARRKAAEISLKTSEAHYSRSLAEAGFLKERLQALSRQVLRMQEDERRKISRDLHDVIAQSLMGINVRLATLRKQAGLNTRDFRRNIAATQKLLERAALVVHRFASALRPPVLDDLGLVPALRSLLKDFTLRTGVPAELKVCSGAEKLAPARRTALFRVAQEALANVERHSAASAVKLTLRETGSSIVMDVADNGRGFSVQKVLRTSGNKHLGLLGMRERVEMVGGAMRIDSSRARGTTIVVEMPAGRFKIKPDASQ